MEDNAYAQYISLFLQNGGYKLYTTIQEHLPTLIPIIQKLYYSGSILTSHLLAVLYPLFAKFYSSHPDLASIGLLIGILYLTLRTFQMVTRWMYGLAMGMVKIVFVMAIVMGISRISQRGMDQTLEDLKSVWGVLESAGGVGMKLLEVAMSAAEEGKQTKGRSAGYKPKPRESKGFW